MSESNPIKIYHNPRCSKSRQTLELLGKSGVLPEIVEYLKTPPNKGELTKILDLLGLEPRELMRKSEAEYKAAGMDDESLSRDELIALMVDHPKVIERPIVIANGKAIIGRPPELVLEII
ncbi:MAG TPA: arsenate reductase (glutaredoxin) [Gammaproteobacteria bacterium]|jgi:arsenate reductase|nr:arsenate reductase (glutaredoxin) [Gammaproteobacteria bacterium]